MVAFFVLFEAVSILSILVLNGRFLFLFNHRRLFIGHKIGVLVKDLGDVIALFVNHSYFKKRAHLFTNP